MLDTDFSNPNLPTPIGSGLVWPQFDESNNMFMELNSENLTVISTPRKDKMDAIIEDLYTARQMQLVADGPPKSKMCQGKGDLFNHARLSFTNLTSWLLTLFFKVSIVIFVICKCFVPKCRLIDMHIPK